MAVLSTHPYQPCTITVMDTTDPEIEFDDVGESSYVRYFNKVIAPVLVPAQAGYSLPQRFGFDKRIAHYSSLPLTGEMLGDELMALLETPNYPEELRKQDHEIIASSPNHYTDYPNSEASVRRLFGFTAWVGGVLRKLRLLR